MSGAQVVQSFSCLLVKHPGLSLALKSRLSRKYQGLRYLRFLSELPFLANTFSRAVSRQSPTKDQKLKNFWTIPLLQVLKHTHLMRFIQKRAKKQTKFNRKSNPLKKHATNLKKRSQTLRYNPHRNYKYSYKKVLFHNMVDSVF